jgi:PPIC-type PPIASE domain
MRIKMGRNRMVAVLGLATVAGVAFFWGRSTSVSQAKSPPQTPMPVTAPTGQANAAPASDYSKRVVAYIYGTIPITREELGEYLIARMGVERLQNLVNLRIIEHTCKEKGIEVSAAEVEAEFKDYLQKLSVGMTVKQFEEKMLRPRNKSLYEWKEDVVKPEIMMRKLCRDRVHVTDQDLQQAFDAYYGEKVKCRIILWPREERKNAERLYTKIRDSEDEFQHYARIQASPGLAANGGAITPIAHHTAGNDQLEKAAFSLKPGEVSQLIEAPEGCVVIKCDGKVAADTSKKLEQEREHLAKEVTDAKIRMEIPKLFSELREKANTNIIMTHPLTEDELRAHVDQELRSTEPSKIQPVSHRN